MIEKNVPTIGEERPADHRLAHLEPGEPFVLVSETTDLVPLPPEGLREQDPRDRQGLLGDRGEVGDVLAVLVATSRRARPTFTVSQRKNGSMNSDSTVSCHERSSIATSVLAITTTFDRMFEPCR